MFEMLRRVTGLDIAARDLAGLDLQCRLPQFGVTAQSVHDRCVSLRLFRMTGARVVLFENRMMNNCGTHCGGSVSEARALARARFVIKPSLTVGLADTGFQ